MVHAQLSDVQLSNLSQLFAIRHSLACDRLEACCRFALDATLADALLALTVPQVLALVANVGHQSLFPPRRDLAALIQAPLPLSGSLAASQSTAP